MYNHYYPNSAKPKTKIKIINYRELSPEVLTGVPFKTPAWRGELRTQTILGLDQS